MVDCCVFDDTLLSFEFFLRCRLLILSDMLLEWVCEKPISEPFCAAIGGLFAERCFGLEFRLWERRRLPLRSILWEGANMIPQPGAAIVLELGSSLVVIDGKLGVFLDDGTAHHQHHDDSQARRAEPTY